MAATLALAQYLHATGCRPANVGVQRMIVGKTVPRILRDVSPISLGSVVLGNKKARLDRSSRAHSSLIKAVNFAGVQPTAPTSAYCNNYRVSIRLVQKTVKRITGSKTPRVHLSGSLRQDYFFGLKLNCGGKAERRAGHKRLWVIARENESMISICLYRHVIEIGAIEEQWSATVLTLWMTSQEISGMHLKRSSFKI